MPTSVPDPGELELLRATARGVLATSGTLPDLGRLGLLGLLTPESSGGSGWNVVEAVAVATEAGRALSPLPIAGNLVAAAALAGFPGGEPLAARLVEGTAGAAFVERPGSTPADGGWRVSGAYAVPGTGSPDVLVLASPGRPLVAVDRADLSCRLQPDALDSSRGTVLLTADDAPARALPGADRDTLADAAVLLACADTLGALAVTVERVTRHLSDRDAFGQPLAAFQVLQHRLVDLDVLVVTTGSLVSAAATALADRAPHAAALVRAAHTFLAERAPAALDDCVQLSGGLGVTWEWPVHHAVRRAVVDAAVRPSAVPSADEMRTALEVERPAIPGTEDVRRHVRSVIAESDPPPAREGHRAPTTPEQEARLRAWYRTLYDTGLLGGWWPEEEGGSPGFRPAHQLVVTEELIRARAPRAIDQVQLASHVLLEFGTAEQKQRYLPRIRSVEDIWCQLFSEPGAGSDLAGVRTRGEQRDDGSWVLTGQKTWTTDGHWAQHGLALVRTSAEAKRHAGLTVFIVPMDAPGVEVRPIRMNSDAVDINETFLDGVVLGPEQVLGDVGQGWAIAMSGLEVERVNVGANVVLLEQLLSDVLTVAGELRSDGAPLAGDPVVRGGIAGLLARFEAARAFVSGHVERVLAGREGESEGPIAKLLYTEAYNEIARYGTQLVATYGPAEGAGAEAAGRLQDAWLWSRVQTISGGSSEVMRNILAKRRLRLPSGR
ncbi:acyl-CoA dehydrogenase [Blastococcus sp. URHD0036]|uniref:acyl-CoA dehydrogenase n=1 Tax=Blastococcus sp. URHD0036 TaxID=1380356 RepID=UPI0009DDA4BD|nr:acyl-CoA dehydrogenase [Blastococcus sp. URHD0036]